MTTKRILIILVCLDALFILLHLFLGWRIFNLNNENNFPTAYMSVKLSAVGLIFGLIAIKQHRYFWGVVSGLLILMGIDEIISLHENTTYFLNKVVNFPAWSYSPTYNWLVFLSPIIVLAFALLIIFVKKVFKEDRGVGKYLLAGIILFGLALILEFLSAFIGKPYRGIEVVLEEGAEILAATLFLSGAYGFFDKVFKLA